MGIARKLYEASAADVWRAVRRRAPGRRTRARPPRRYQSVTRAFLESDAYRALMSEHLPHPGVYDRHEAQNETRSYRFRHGEASTRLGAFRWRGLQEHLPEVLGLVDGPGLVVDFGGGACPVGLATRVLDRLEVDGLGRPVPFRDVADLPERVDGLFTSHTLEHVEQLEPTLEALFARLAPGGRVIAHLPSYTCVRWRAGEHANALYGDHLFTFGLSGDDKPAGLQRYVDVDALFSRFARVEQAGYCGDDSIYLSAVRP